MSLTLSHSVSTPQAPRAARVAAPRVRRWRWRLLGCTVALLILAVASLFIPAVFQAAFRAFVSVEAWRHGSEVQIESVRGSLYEPVRLTHCTWLARSEAGSFTRIDVVEAEAVFEWRALLPWHGGRWFQRVSLHGVTGRIEIPVSTPPDAPTLATPSPLEARIASWYPTPAVVQAEQVDLTIKTGQDSVHMQDSRWITSQWEPGIVEAGQVEVKQPWLNRTFRNVRGTTALAESRILIANLKLEPEVQVDSLSADLSAMAEGRLNFAISMSAFGGRISAEAKTRPGGRQIQLEANGNFSQIAIAPFASFLGRSEAAGGLIEEGHFTFRGAPADLPRSTFTLRLGARNFQWESRQWDSLVLGATLIERRVQIPEFELRQGQNTLSLTGEFALPTAAMPWWQTEFNVNVAARIDNLTDLSALFMPEFKFAAGKGSIDGSVRGKDQKFQGALIVSGSDITWRSAPIKELQAAVRLNGNELQLANLDLVNGGDYLHGRGVINILGAKQYWGELRASVEDLATYSALLQPPLVPEPLAGGALLSWSGEGSAERYSGTFFARLQKIRSLGATGPRLHPVNAELEGAYAPREVQFSRFTVSDGTSSFAAKVQVGKKSIDLREIRLLQDREQMALEGEAILPVDVWSAWPDGSLEKVLVQNAPVEFKLKAAKLRLHDALRLSGWNWPLEGVVTGAAEGHGAGPALEMNGQLELREASFPLGWGGVVISQGSADLGLSGHAVKLTAGTGTHDAAKYDAAGEVDLQNLCDPVWNLTLHAPAARVRLYPEWTYPSPLELGPGQHLVGLVAETALDLHLTGPAHGATIAGTAVVNAVSTASFDIDLEHVWKFSASPLPPIFSWVGETWKSCRMDVQCTSAGDCRFNSFRRQNAAHGSALVERLTLRSGPFGREQWEARNPVPAVEPPPEEAGSLSIALQITGTAAAPEPVGEIHVENAPVLSGGLPLTLSLGTVTYRAGSPADPTLDFTFHGALNGFPFTASMLGPFSHRITFVDSEEARELLFNGSPISAAAGDGRSSNPFRPTPPAADAPLPAPANSAPANPAEPPKAPAPAPPAAVPPNP